ncbi:pseudouridine synthase [Aliikangiella coralliicola]|uniref:Pseudouridine synthase n=1 Tax=Aliikangiella coralliicola TaxID=2592383 RepID=A0A545U4R2_9GAMM|nr:16S rRNA pseudouridine(516) synthase [Aliikangiella coralliicola]TQV84456.1 16S rRNA pseudouridine(516) synthase [Aliikangiella coralliicola]
MAKAIKAVRLDKYIAQAAGVTRSQAKDLIKHRRVKVSEQIVTDPACKTHVSDIVSLDDETLKGAGNYYLALHKPDGFICSTQDEIHPSALNLIKDIPPQDLHFAGRLDVDTTGLVLISNDGQWTHRVTSPKRLCAKVYRVWLAENISESALERLRNGLILKSDVKKTLSCHVAKVSERELLMTLYEGRYHQVKRMIGAVENRVVRLHREKVGDIDVSGLAEGEWRYLSDEEIAAFE